MPNEKQLNNQIIDLLFEHDCVIIPGFGGFVAQYSAASFEEKNQTFKPPSKSILFNKNLINNDGLLAHKYVSSYQLTYDEAVASIQDEVEIIKKNLLKFKRHELTGLGIFFMDGTNIKFEKSENNFLASSFGLPTFSVDSFDSNEFNKEEEEKKIIPITPKPSKASKWWVAAAIVPFLFYSVWIPLKTNLFNNEASFHYSELNPFSFTKERTYSFNDLNDGLNDNSSIESTENIDEPIQTPTIEEVPVNPVNVVENPIEKESKNNESTENVDEPIETPTIEEAHVNPVNVVENPVEKESTNVVYNNSIDNEDSSELSFHVIGGCFKNKNNATKLIKKLKKMGFDSFELDINNNLHRIVISSFSTKKEARQAQKEIKATHGFSSWVLNK
ncbi:MAG: SPOR domain-containing protein [Flavobacteriales bacterium]|nr:SPOR domain-containing protein [Flavobacteriales bacterium]